MQVQVGIYVDEGGAEQVRRFPFDSRVTRSLRISTSGMALRIVT